MQYRREIDGLRALAVVPVILFHAGFRTFSGGFVGVDVFFVISGYLITTIILDEKREGTFTVLRFYDRRARRILPALFLVLFSCLPFAWMWLLPADFKGFSISLVAVLAFCSNFYFWRSGGGYFDSDADLQPLLHTWSLAVEEQYYVLFPLLILVIWRLKRVRAMQVLGLIAIVSLAGAHWASLARPRAAFFLLPTRSWELLIGALIAFHFSRRSPGLPAVSAGDRGYRDQVGSALGLLMVVYAIFMFDESTPFPGFHALVPTLGAGLIILFATPQTRVGRWLGHPLPVGIGLISYSLYLWHQPLLAFARHRSLLEPDRALMAALAVGAAVPAWLTWRFVERPFRRRGVFTQRQVFATSLACGLVLASFGLVVVAAQGMPQRFPADVIARASGNRDQNPRSAACHALPKSSIPPEKACVLGDVSKVDGLLIGDSHANNLAAAFDQALRARGEGFRQLTMAGCPSIFDVYSSYGGLDCYRHNEEVGRFVETDRTSEIVVLDMRWTKWLLGNGFDNSEGGVERGPATAADLVSDGSLLHHSEIERKQLVKQRYVRSIERYLGTGKRIVLIYPVPEVGYNASLYSAKRALFDSVDGRPRELTTSYAAYLARNREAIDVLDSLGDRTNLIRVKPESIFCNSFVKDRCAVEWDGVSFYSDDNHLSSEGGRLVVEEVMRRLDAARRSQTASRVSTSGASSAANGSM